MNIAFPALVVFLIILPGSIFHLAFKSTEKTVVDQTPFAATFVKWIVLAGLLHLVWVAAAGAIGFPVDFNTLLMLLASPQRENSMVLAIESAARHFEKILTYFMTLFAFAAVLGYLLKVSVVKYRLDMTPIIGPFLGSDTPWYYLFTAHNEDFEVDGVVISAIVEIEKTGYIYTGLLKEYFCAPDGTLDRLVLEMTMRRPLSADVLDGPVTEDKFARFYRIEGDYFVLRYAEITTLNIEFLKVEDI